MERRHVNRIKVSSPLIYEVPQSTSQQNYRGVTCDLSQSGIGAILPNRLPKESTIKCRVKLGASDIIEVEGVVMWQYQLNGALSSEMSSGYLTGIQFSRVENSVLQLVTDLIGKDRLASTQHYSNKMRAARITSTASFLPKEIVTNNDIIASGLKSTDSAVRRALGAIERRSIQQGCNASDLMAEVAKSILAESGKHPSDIDMIICAVNPSDAIAPDVGSMVQAKIGAHCPAFEINMSCAGWLCGLDIASNYLAGERKAILVLAASTLGAFLPYRNLMHRAIFGDGAGGVLLETDSSGEGGILACELWNRGEYATHIFAPLPWTITPSGIPDDYKGYFYMNPDREVFFNVMDQHLVPFVNRTLRKANVSLDAIDVFLLHYPSRFLFEHSLKLLRVPESKVVENFPHYGNLAAAEFPVLLDENIRAGKIKKGDLALLFTYGSGFTSACAIVRL